MGERASSREGEGAAPRALSPPGKAGGDVTGNPRLKPRGRALPRQGSYPSRQDLRSRPEAPLTGTLLRPPPFTACAGRRGTRAPPAFGASNRRARARGRGGRKGAAREAAAGAAGIPPGPIGRRPGDNGGGRDLPGPVPARICRRSCRENRRQTAGEGGDRLVAARPGIHRGQRLPKVTRAGVTSPWRPRFARCRFGAR